MGKSRRNQKKKNRKNCNKDEFSNILCTKCSLCIAKATPTFCHWFYKNSKKKFLNVVYPELRSLEWPSSGYTQVAIFSKTFCDNCTVFEGNKKDTPVCKKFEECFNSLKLQVDPVYSNNLFSTDFGVSVLRKYLKRHIEQKTTTKYVVQPYPTFFYSKKDPNWIIELNELDS